MQIGGLGYVKKASVKKFRKVLVANRGRLQLHFQSVGELGITTVSIYSKEDR